MSTSSDTIIYLSDQLTQLGSRIISRKMFGEYALYCDYKVVGLICDDQLYLKITPSSLAMLSSSYNQGSPYPGAKPMFLIGADLIEDSDSLSRLVDQIANDLPVPKPKKHL